MGRAAASSERSPGSVPGTVCWSGTSGKTCQTGPTSTAETIQSICQSVRQLPSTILLNLLFSMISLQLLNMLSTYLIIRKIHRWVIGDYFSGYFYILKLPTSQDHFLLFFLFILFVSLLPIIYFKSLYGWVLIKNNQDHQINRLKP